MDPMDRGSEDPNIRNTAAGPGDAAARSRAAEGSGFGGDAALPVPLGPSGSDPATSARALADKGARRPVQIIAGELRVTVNPIDGSEVELCPPDLRPPLPVRRSAEERAELARTARPPLPPGLVPNRPPLPEYQEVRRRLVRLLSRGRSVRLTGPPGSGRTTLLEGVAEDCAHLAPDGVIRLSGHRRTVKDLLYDLFSTVYAAEGYRPDDGLLRRLVGEIGAVVLLDDLEFGGQALDELLDATPECAFVLAATPDAPAPSSDLPLEEIFLSGVGRNDGMDLLRQTVGRELTEEERSWAGDLWFASEGLPARFVQAGALLRYRDQAHARAAQQDPLSGPAPVPEVPLPSLAEGSAPVALLASLLSPTARALLQFAVALGGEVPHRAQLPALLSDPHADGALGELLTAGLLTPVGARYRLAAGIQPQLEAAGYGEGAAARADAAGEHYIWWTGHRSVAPERVLAESDTVLATLAALVPNATVPSGPSGTDGERNRAVHLARTAAPAFVAALDWGVWERALRSGQEAARRAGEVAEEAYFHHELGVLALCTGRLDRARAELEASIGLRGVLADKRGTVTGRRALALVEDRAAAGESGSGPAAPVEPRQDGPSTRSGPSRSGDDPMPSAAQTSFGAGVPFLAPEDPPTTELRQISDRPKAPAAASDAAGGTGATLPGTPGHRQPDGGYPDADEADLYARSDGLSYSRFGEGPYPGPAEDPEPEPGGDSHGDPEGPATLVARGPGRAAADEGPVVRSDGRRGTAKNTKRNLVAAAGGTLLAAILGTVVTLGTTSDHGKPSSTVDPDPSVSQQDGDGVPAGEQASQSDDPSTASPSSSSGSPSTSGSTSPTASGTTGVPGDGGHASSASGKPSNEATTKRPTHRPPATTKPPTTKPPTSKPPTSSPPASPSGSTTPDPGAPDATGTTADRLSAGASSTGAHS